MQANVPLGRVREIRPERRPRRLVFGELGLRGEREISKTACMVGELRAIEAIRPAKLRQLRREPLPLRAPAFRVGPSFESVESTHGARSLPTGIDTHRKARLCVADRFVIQTKSRSI